VLLNNCQRFLKLYSHDRVWLPFLLRVPAHHTVQLEFNVTTPNATVDGVAPLHIRDVRFGNSGENVMCAAPHIHYKSVSHTVLYQSDGVQTFMQLDRMLSTIGYVINSGVTVDQKRWEEDGAHDVLALEVEVEMSDVNLAGEVEVEVAADINDGQLLVIGTFFSFSFR